MVRNFLRICILLFITHHAYGIESHRYKNPSHGFNIGNLDQEDGPSETETREVASPWVSAIHKGLAGIYGARNADMGLLRIRFSEHFGENVNLYVLVEGVFGTGAVGVHYDSRVPGILEKLKDIVKGTGLRQPNSIRYIDDLCERALFVRRK